MEVQINNSYLQNFISKYSHQSETKVVKYLAILGLHFLEKNSKDDISLTELKGFAKSVMKPQIKQSEVDLRVIKEELLKLSKRVEGKLANSAPQQQEEGEKPKVSKKNGKQPLNTNLSKTSSSSKKIDTPTFSQKPPSARKEIEKRGSELRVSQLENIQENNSREQKLARQSPSNRYIEWQEGSIGTMKDEYGLTPKPNEIVFTGIETRGLKNTVTRHHLDDSQFKATMKEEGIVSYSNRVKNETPKQKKIPVYQNSSSKKENKLGSNSSFTDRKPQELRDTPLSAWNSEIRSPQAQLSQAKSPQFSQTREYFPGEKQQSYAFDINKEELSKTSAPSSANRASRRDERSGQRVQKREDSGVRNSQSSKALKSGGSLNSSKATTSSHVRNKSGYKNVDSKIKDEINYHKELSKQYKKLKQNMGNFDDIQEELLGSSTRRAFSKEPMNDDLNTFEESSRYNTRQNTYNNTGGSALKTSQNFAEKTPIQPAYSRANAKPETGAWRNEETTTNQYTYTEESKGGMLDIANNFLNSPLMQHLSNIDMRNLDTSMKDSIFNTNFKPNKNSDSLMFTGGMEFKGATIPTLEGEEEARLRQSGGNGLGQSRNSKWDNADYQLEKNIKVNASILKDSTNRRFRDNMSKEIQGTGNVYDKEGPNSLASSNFSNFLNDEMKGFYQKEPFDTKRAQVKFGNSENSSNMSFSMNGAAATTREKSAEKNYFRRGGFKEENENKTSETFSFDNANVFKNERMSITHLMSN
jgi:hypothetical protein